MLNPRVISPVLSLLLLMTSMVGLVGHDHGAEMLGGSGARAEAECAIDHERELGNATHGSKAELLASGQRHRHQCAGCHLGSQRLLLTAGRGVVIDLANGTEGPGLPTAIPRVSLSWTGRTLRGPPLA